MQFPDRVTDPATQGTTLMADKDKPVAMFRCGRAGCGKEFKTQQGLSMHVTRAHGKPKPKADAAPPMRMAEPREPRANERLRIVRHSFVSAVLDPDVSRMELDKTLLMLDSLHGLVETLRSR